MGQANSNLKLWMLCVVLTLPSLVPVALHYYLAESAWQRQATGFIQYDQAYYLANARQYFDDGQFSFSYKNPNDYRADSPKIYCQPQTLAIGAICHFTNWKPVYVFLGFGWLFTLFTIRVGYSLLNEFMPITNGERTFTRTFVFALFVWGGGLFTLAGLIAWGLAGGNGSLQGLIFEYDPFDGWWFLNLGRNFVFPMESYYHFLFLGGALFMARGQTKLALATGAIIGWSHPFTGVTYLLLLLGWLFLERVFWGNMKVAWWAIVAALLMLGLHIGYYQIFLMRFEAHKEIHGTWQLAWEYKGIHMLLGYGIVGGFAAWRLRTSAKFAEFLQLPKHRMLIVWFLAAFLLANHEFFMKSTQPLHFTRGYVWMPLFLIGSVAMARLFESDTKSTNGPNSLAIVIVGFLMLIDNLAWLSLSQTNVIHNTLHTSYDHSMAIQSLNEAPLGDIPANEFIIVTNSPNFGLLSTVGTPYEAFVAHEYLTPQIGERTEMLKALLSEGTQIEELTGKNQMLVLIDDFALNESDTNEARRARLIQSYQNANFDVELVKENDEFAIWKCIPHAN